MEKNDELTSDPFATPRRLPPISLGFEVFSGIRQQLFPAVVALFGATRGGQWGLIFGSCFFLISIAYSVFKYWTLQYQIRDDELIVDEGILFRVHRTVPLEKIQNIDLLQNPLHRFCGVAEVRIETASGTEPEAILRVLKLDEVDRMRKRVFGRQSTTQTNSADATQPPPTDSQPADDQPAQVLLLVSTPMLIKAGLASNRGWLLIAVIFGGLFQFDPFSGRAGFNLNAWIGWIPAMQTRFGWLLLIVVVVTTGLLLLRILSIAWYVIRFHGYQLSRLGDDLRIQGGLFTKISASVPRHRIQFISIHRSWLARYMGIAAIRIETAGGGAAKTEDAAATMSRRWFIPAIAEADIARILTELRPGLSLDESSLDWKPLARLAARRMRRLTLTTTCFALLLVLIFQFWFAALVILALAAVAWWYVGKKARSNRYARGDFGIAYRSGLLVKKTSVTFMKSVQTVRIASSPFDRRWDMATLILDTPAAGPAEHTIEIAMLDSQFAAIERDAIARLASLAAFQHQPHPMIATGS